MSSTRALQKGILFGGHAGFARDFELFFIAVALLPITTMLVLATNYTTATLLIKKAGKMMGACERSLHLS